MNSIGFPVIGTPVIRVGATNISTIRMGEDDSVVEYANDVYFYTADGERFVTSDDMPFVVR